DGVDAGPNGDLRTSGRKRLGQDVDPRRLAADEAWRGLDDPDLQQVLEAPPDPDDELAGPDRGEEQVRGATQVPDYLVRDRLVALDAERVVVVDRTPARPAQDPGQQLRPGLPTGDRRLPSVDAHKVQEAHRHLGWEEDQAPKAGRAGVGRRRHAVVPGRGPRQAPVAEVARHGGGYRMEAVLVRPGRVDGLVLPEDLRSVGAQHPFAAEQRCVALAQRDAV